MSPADFGRRLWSSGPKVTVVLGAVSILTLALSAQDPSCTECHGSADKLRAALGDAAVKVDRLLVDQAVLQRSVHGTRACDECHMEFGPYPHSKDKTTAGCADCHEAVNDKYGKSVHGRAVEGRKELPVKCNECHGIHDVLKPTDRASTFHPLNVHITCTKCHANGGDAPLGSHARFEKYASDIHAKGLIVAGLTVSATCVSCHGGHEVHAKGDPESPLARHRVDAKCGSCHVVPLEEYRKSIHHLRSNGKEHKGATCTDCHRPHGLSPALPSFIKDSVDACTTCHDERGTSFRLTYHGKVTSLG